MGPFRHPLLGGCSKRLTLVGSLGYSGTGVAVDPIHRIWMIQSGVTVYYGTYAPDSTAHYGGSITGIPSEVSHESSGLAIDPERCLWWVASQFGGTLVYGTYNATTGLPTKGGQITLAQGAGVQRVVIDPDLLLWWTGNDSGTSISYGTYNASTGLPTVTGTQTVPGAGSYNRNMTVDIARRLMWGESAAHVMSYSTSGVLTATAVEQLTPLDGGIDYDRGLMLGCGSSPLSYGLWSLEADGALTLLDDLAHGAYVWQAAVDPDSALVICATGDILSYCK